MWKGSGRVMASKADSGHCSFNFRSDNTRLLIRLARIYPVEHDTVRMEPPQMSMVRVVEEK